MSRSFVLACDLGSSACKTVLMDTAGRVLAAAQQEITTYYPRPGWVEQEPEDWYRAFVATTRETVARAGFPEPAVKGVGIVGVTHNTVMLDAGGRPLGPCILIFDNRSAAQSRRIQERWGEEVRRRTLNDCSPLWSWPQLAWIREERPETWRAARHVVFAKDYVRFRLTGSLLTDTIDAAGSLLFDPVAGRWIEEFCRDLGLDPAWLPRAVAPLEVVGSVSRAAAAETGLASGTPVIAGTTDTAAEVLGSGGVRPGRAVVKLASVGRVAVVSERPADRPRVLNYRHVLPGLWYPGTACKNAASSYRWLRELLWPSEQLSDPGLYRRMDEQAAPVPVGCDGLVFLPHLAGEWAPHFDERMRASFVGLTAAHGRGHAARAVLEGVAFGLRDALEDLEAAGVKAERILLIGAGSRSPLWARIVCDVFGRPLVLPREPDAAYGAALITAMGLGLIEAAPHAMEAFTAPVGEIEPQPEASRSYEGLFARYRRLDSLLKEEAGRGGAE